MSLINQMLKDLDARHESDMRGRLHRDVRPLPSAGDGRFLRLAIGGLLALAMLVAAWLAVVRFSLFSPDLLLPDVVPAPVSSGGGRAEVLSPESPLATAAVDMPSPVASVPEASNGLKLSSMLDRPPATKSAEPPLPARAPAPRQETPTQTLPAKPVTTETATKAAPSRIEKQSSAAKTAGEESEQEYRRALALVNAARGQEATDLLLDSLLHNGGHVASRQLLVRLLIEQRRLNEAYALLAEGLALKPAQTGWAMTLARLQVERGDLPAAARTLQGSLPHALDNADYLGFTGHVQHRLGQQKAAVESYQGAVRLSPNEGRWWLGLGLALEADIRQAEAREAFLRARASGSLNADLGALVDQKLR